MKTIKYLLFVLPAILQAQFGSNENLDNWPPEIDNDTTYTYKVIDDTKLNLWVFNRSKVNDSVKKPAIVFFFGGGFRIGTPNQFVEHSKYLSARGMVSIVVDYRVLSRNKTKPIKCLNDAKSAIRWVRKHSEILGIDPNRIVASGGSAGGALAAATGTISMFDEENEDLSISSKPNAMILFNPALINSSVEEYQFSEARAQNMTISRFGVKPELFSPYNLINDQTPPTIIFHGDKDDKVNPRTAELFNQKMKKFGNECHLHMYKGQNHGFFNFGIASNGPFVDTIRKVDDFLVNLGYIDSLPVSTSM